MKGMDTVPPSVPRGRGIALYHVDASPQSAPMVPANPLTSLQGYFIGGKVVRAH